MGAATVAVGWSGYFVSLLRSFGIIFPAQWTGPAGEAVTRADGTTVTAVLNLPAVLIVAVLTILLMLGTRESTRVNNIMVVFKLFVVLVVIVVGAFYVSRAHWSPFIPPNTGKFGHFGWTGILRGASVVFFAYIGFDAVSTAAQEARSPQRDMPVGILGSLLICTLLYIGMALVMTGIVPYPKLAVADPVAVAIDATGIAWLAVLVKFAALAGLTTVIFVLLFGQARILFSIARDGLLPAFFSAVHPRFRTPLASQALIGAVVAVVAGVFPIGLLGEMVSIGTLFAFLLVCLAVIQLRRTRPRTHRPFRTPAVPWVPLFGIGFSLSADDRPAPGHLAEADCLAGDWAGDLLRLRTPPQRRGGDAGAVNRVQQGVPKQHQAIIAPEHPLPKHEAWHAEHAKPHRLVQDSLALSPRFRVVERIGKRGLVESGRTGACEAQGAVHGG
jgi:basic amino acid/polyamine antiporter, APA family